MKKFLLFFSSILLVLTFSAANADMKDKAKQACHNIEKACVHAGYYKGGVKVGKGIWTNCGELILNGQSVHGVNVSKKDAFLCKAAYHKVTEQ